MTSHTMLVAIFGGAVTVAVVATVVSLGLLFTTGLVLAPLRRWPLLAGMVLLNAVAVPAVAWGLTRALPVANAAAVGLTLAATGAGSAAGLKAAQLSRRADLALAVVLTVALQLANIVAVPLWSGAVAGAGVSRLFIVRSLIILILLPLIAGFLVRGRFPHVAARLHGPVSGLATTALVVAIVVGIAANTRALYEVATSWTPVAALLTIVAGLVLGAMIGHHDAATRTTTSLVSAVRLTSLGLVLVTTQLGAEPEYLGPAITFALLDLIVPLVLALVLASRLTSTTGPMMRWRRRGRRRA
jgi:BASS family bile acid:Na+ symporter